ncbi:MAG TPA: hypothetical protein VGQ62_18735 [Chloroflexota bacterium]|nr:hypothetical protein [Chloroflexota bacterium]
MPAGIQLDSASAARCFGESYFNLIRRGADGSLTLSADHWRLARVSEDGFDFEAREPEAPPLHLPLAEVERVRWDRLPKQQARSQLRFHLQNGDLWTFSGAVDETALPPADKPSDEN